MSDEQPVTFKSSEMLGLQCPKCGPETNLEAAFIDLRRAQVVVTCRCKNLVGALALSSEAYRAAVEIKLDSVEQSRILVPKFGGADH